MKAMFLVALLLLSACGSDDKGSGRVCEPGKTEECACVGGLTKGAQTCEESGAAWGKCECPGDGSGGSGNAQNGSGGGSALHCTPGASESCVCSETCDVYGKRQCDTQGNWSSCDSATCQDLRSSTPQCFP